MDTYSSIYSKAGLGNPSTLIQSSFGGMDYRSRGLPIAANTDSSGLVFITRPRLNLSYHNLVVFPEFKSYLDEDVNSLKRAVRCLLDPVANNDSFRRAFNARFGLGKEKGKPEVPLLESNLVDPLNPFIPFLSTNLLSMSGWPDRALTVKTTDEGMRRESMSFPDGVYEINNVFDCTHTFRSLAGDPITLLFNLWCSWTSMIRTGSNNANLLRYLDDILRKEQSFTTREYRLVLDSSKRYVRKMAMTGWGFPVGINEAGSFDYEHGSTMPEGEVRTVQFSNTVARYNHPSIAMCFNRINAMYNPALIPSEKNNPDSPIIGVANGTYKKLITDEDIAVNNRNIYPRIKLSDMELELYAPIKSGVVNGQ